jgi:hypothetical protein
MPPWRRQGRGAQNPRHDPTARPNAAQTGTSAVVGGDPGRADVRALRCRQGRPVVRSPPVGVLPPSTPRRYRTGRGISEWLLRRFGGMGRKQRFDRAEGERGESASTRGGARGKAALSPGEAERPTPRREPTGCIVISPDRARGNPAPPVSPVGESRQRAAGIRAAPRERSGGVGRATLGWQLSEDDT